MLRFKSLFGEPPASSVEVDNSFSRIKPRCVRNPRVHGWAVSAHSPMIKFLPIERICEIA